MTRILIIGGGFVGLNTAKVLSGIKDVEVTLIDQNNYHLFQPLLYQVATAGLSPAEIRSNINCLVRRGGLVIVICPLFKNLFNNTILLSS